MKFKSSSIFFFSKIFRFSSNTRLFCDPHILQSGTYQADNSSSQDFKAILDYFFAKFRPNLA